jgi:ComF family protein
MLDKIFDPLLALVYPQNCQNCRSIVEKSADGVVCSDCWQKTQIFSGVETLCEKCSKFLQAKPTDFQTFCHICDKDFYDSARAVGLYEDALTASILHLKSEPFVCRRLKDLFVSAFEKTPFYDADMLVPVPLSKRRRLERGFNQAEVLAEILSKKTSLKLNKHSLVRKLHTPMHRAAMDRKARELTVQNAFEVVRPKLIENQKILLIDDVFTSGATASFCAKALKKNGAQKVYIFTIARVN